ncbi:hypothetical protein CONPUDRAFT_148759 [Coniophora puteana RWD-64-598 SS2]|uniref:Uncharacterized protein n=1 Tax=Coniophora puteana (strain RWD-64-598) TaxID=741705 RepID=A0A5M3N5N0_CONPW|nr:uncharacterized protein CONPUDRAFT_148759 [Coniophora puteana RWD-64-598 SS2]EIW86693.1 hypothetical protein CONPUDRAFT_148759 [Coniophora puteana RWD-64-598 SS2]
MPRAPVAASRLCSCRSHGCGRHSSGSKPQQPRTFRRHREADELLYAKEGARLTAAEATNEHVPHVDGSEHGDTFDADDYAYDNGFEAHDEGFSDEFQDDHAKEDGGEPLQHRGYEQNLLFGDNHNPTLDEDDDTPPSDDEFFTRLVRARTPPASPEGSEDEDEEAAQPEENQENEAHDPAQDKLDNTFKITLDELYDFSDVQDVLQPYNHDELPQAFDDHPAIRNAYIRAFVLVVCEGICRITTPRR